MVLLAIGLLVSWLICRDEPYLGPEGHTPILQKALVTCMITAMVFWFGMLCSMICPERTTGGWTEEHTIQECMCDGEIYVIKWDDKINQYDREDVKENDSLAPHTIKIKTETKAPEKWTAWVFCPLSSSLTRNQIVEVNINP